jgi:hypothetical protein
MKIHNIRLGFATNSSSSHSLIYVADDKLSNVQGDHYDINDMMGFGRNSFTLTDNEYKLKYALSTILYQMSYLWTNKTIFKREKNIALKLLKELFKGIDIPCKGLTHNHELDDVPGFIPIDHQSRMVMPRQYGSSTKLNKEFLKDFISFITNKNTIVLGGDDGGDHPAYSDNKIDARRMFADYPLEESSVEWVCRKDPVHNYWTLFNTVTGSKMRFSWAHDAVAPEKAYAPELVDMKITDYCDIGCKYCYQASTESGGHASLKTIKQYLSMLSKAQVFEVALGGGETTKHPHLLSILKSARALGIVPNFTTKSMHWLNDKKHAESIIRTCGAFAFSIGSVQELSNLLSILDTNFERSLWTSKLHVQLVMGTISKQNFDEILSMASMAHVPVTLLGYKTQGRGDNYKPLDYSWWTDSISNSRCPTLKIDTALASQSQDFLSKHVSSYLYHILEGKFSAYIDATKEVMAPSSYCDKAQYYSIKNLSDIKDLLSIFEKF